MSAARDLQGWPRPVETEAQWRELAARATAQLGALLGTPAVAEPLTLLERGGYSCRIRGERELGGALQLEWSGILRLVAVDGPADGAAPRDGRGARPQQLSASLFLFSRGRRMQAAGQLGSSLELVFEPTSASPPDEPPPAPTDAAARAAPPRRRRPPRPAPGRWLVLGWHDDIYGEYEDLEL